MKKVVAKTDESSHWYVIPEELNEEFNRLMEQYYLADNRDDYDTVDEIVDEFESKFAKYRTGGDLNNIQLYAEIE